ncbi:hypothetical protein UFOVP616_20 [uncultured Caudovirales phage]|uniref:Uncharacterized protein n=1 Tax=uncultured Caudovirales phage TaxID=2100421 RepID=A0A6J5N5Q0_9CAUD|nr:hypothetical protein UFOVP616_20 [uncultured Caudovirales phage]
MSVETESRPVPYTQITVAKPTLGGRPLKNESYLDNLSDTFAKGWLGMIKDEVEETYIRSQYREADFDGLDNIPKGYEEYASAFSYATSPQEVDQIAYNIDETNAARRRLNENSVIANVGYELVAGILDPINLIGGPALKGAGLVGGFVKGAASIGSVNAATEVIRNTLDPTSTNEETALNIGFGFIVAGMIGGGIGVVTRNGPGVDAAGTTSLTRAQRKTADEVGNNFEQAFKRGEGRATTKLMQFKDSNVRVVDGPTNKVDADGNPVNAFYRSEEAFKEYARRAEVRKAADDALGDIVPDADEVTMFDTGVDDVDPAVQQYVDDYIAGKGRDDPSMEQFAANNADEIEAEFQRRSNGETPPTGEKAAPQTKFESTIFIDTKAILKSFPDKPWTKPRYEGIEPLADDAFKTPEEYANFVAYHELNHTTTPRNADESVAQYENRINTMALDEVRAERLANSPTRGLFQDYALLPTTQGSMTRYAPDEAVVHNLATGVGGDMATQTLSAMAGRASTPGGSVLQRSMRWNAEYFKGSFAIRQGYSKYVNGYASDSEFALGVTNFASQLPIVGAARKQGKMQYDEFNSFVGRAVFDDGEFAIGGRTLLPEEMTIVREAAARIREVNKFVEDSTKELGIFDRQKQIQREIDWREKANVRDEAFLSKATGKRADEVRTRVEERNKELLEFRTAADELAESDIKFKGDDAYFHRIFNVGAIRDRYEDFVDLIAMSFARETGDAGAVTPDIKLRAQQVADRIIGEGVEETAYGFGGGARALKSRVLPLSNKELADFIVLDADIVLGTYIRRMGPIIEMHRAYGSTNLASQIDEMQSELIQKNYTPKMRQKINWEIEAIRDRVLQNFTRTDPLSMSNRTARAIKNIGNVAIMGRGIYSQTVDVAKTVAVEGHGPLFKALHASFSRGLKGVGYGKHGRAGGEGFEMVMARYMARSLEDDSALIVTNQTGIERSLAKMQQPFFVANLMNPFTVMFKDWSSVMTAHRLIADSQTLAKAVRSGKTMGTLSKSEYKLATELASWGINLRSAQLIADMPVDKAEGGLLMPNIDAWEGRAGEMARDVFIGAMSGNIRSNIVTPGPLQRAAIMDGVFRVKKGGVVSRTLGDGSDRLEMPLLSLPFQLLSFTMSSSAKTTHAMLSGRDRNTYITLTSMLIGGYVATYLAAGDNWENMTWEEAAMSAIDRSGVLGWGVDPIKRVETLTGYGPRAALGMEEFGEGQVNDEIGAIGGPAAGVMAGFAEAFISDEQTPGQDADLIRRALPFNQLVWWDETLKEWSRAAAKNAGYDIDLDPPSFFDGEDDEETIEMEETAEPEVVMSQ